MWNEQFSRDAFVRVLSEKSAEMPDDDKERFNEIITLGLWSFFGGID